jgi:hypothetical protein
MKTAAGTIEIDPIMEKKLTAKVKHTLRARKLKYLLRRLLEILIVSLVLLRIF